jgi:hypothetical protein
MRPGTFVIAAALTTCTLWLAATASSSAFASDSTIASIAFVATSPSVASGATIASTSSPASTASLASTSPAASTSPPASSLTADKNGFDDLKPPAPKAQFKPHAIEKPDAISCTACHQKIVDEWKDTGHAIAWIDEEYREQLKEKRKPESCYGCHIPKPMMQAPLSQKPPARDEDRHLGISCESCHLGPKGVMLGPRGTPTSAHPTEKSDAFIGGGSSALCISCHKVNIGPVVGVARDFEQAKLGESGKSCVGCHCASVEQAFANLPTKDASTKSASSGSSDGGDADAPVRKGRSHALQTPRDPSFLARAFEISVASAGGKTVVSVKNAAGHRVPGLIGRRIEIKADALDAQGKAVGQGAAAFDAESYLGLNETASIEVKMPAASVHVTGVEHDPRSTDPIPFLDVTLQVAAR